MKGRGNGEGADFREAPRGRARAVLHPRITSSRHASPRPQDASSVRRNGRRQAAPQANAGTLRETVRLAHQPVIFD